jgi:hypothetical protein
MAKAESVTIRPARGGFIVEAQYPWVPADSGEPAVPSRNVPTVAGSLSSALEKAAGLLGGNVSVSEGSPNALSDDATELFGD